MSRLAQLRQIERLRAVRLQAAEAALAAARAASASAAKALSAAEANRAEAVSARAACAQRLTDDLARAELRLALLDSAEHRSAVAAEQAGRAAEALAERLVAESEDRRRVVLAEARASALAERRAALSRFERVLADEREAREAEEVRQCKA